MSVELTEIEDLGHQLGEAIAELPEYDRFVEAKEAVENSEEARERIQTVESLRQEFMLARQTGEATQEDLRQLQQAERELEELPVMREYQQAQAELSARLAAVNDAISEELAVDFGDEVSGCCQDE